MAFLTTMSRIPHPIIIIYDLMYFLCHYHYYIYLCIHNMGDISFKDTT